MNLTMINKFSIFLLTFLTFQRAIAEHHALRYSTATFYTEVATKDHFVMFYAPWCVHSRNLGPTWKQLARMFNGVDEGQVLIAKVNCDTDSTVCVDNHISGYPSLVFFKAGRSTGTVYTGSFELVALRNFVNQQIGAVDDELERYQSADGRFVTWVYLRL